MRTAAPLPMMIGRREISRSTIMAKLNCRRRHSGFRVFQHLLQLRAFLALYADSGYTAVDRNQGIEPCRQAPSQETHGIVNNTEKEGKPLCASTTTVTPTST